ncbi:MAG: SdpI family protein [Saprospiraceae bacterium]|jgi:uncharacterized membrane protein
MKLFTFKNLLVLGLLCLPYVYLYFIYDGLPDQVGLHFGADMKPDRMGPKSELWSTTSIMMGIALAAYLIVTNLSYFDPKNQNLQSVAQIDKISLLVVLLMSCLSCYIIYSAYSGYIGNALTIILGGFMAILGNLMHNIKPNYFIGMRMPWTLDNENNWRKTHQFGSKIWVAGGLITMLASFLTSPDKVMTYIFIPVVLLMVIIPGIYSYKYFKAGNP